MAECTELPPIDWTAAPARIVALFEAAAAHHASPCGDGTLAWRRWGEAKPGRRPIVLLHGGSGSWSHWIKAIPPLATGGEVWAVDLPGLGDSAMPHAPLTPAHAGAIVAEGAAALLADRPPLHLVAFSFGAHVGVYAAIALADRLASFTVCGCAALGIPHNRVTLAKERSSMTEAEREVVHKINLERLMFHDPARVDDLAVHVQGENIRRARFKSRAFAPTGEIAENLPRVKVPLNAIWGAYDVIATPSVEARYAILRAAGHPELLARTIPDAGHWVAYEQPAAYAATVLELTKARV